MTRKGFRISDGQSERCKAASKPVGMYFFKVLIGDFYTKLYMPPAFARLIEDDASDCAALNSSVGCYQDIEVLKDSYSLFFHNGWRAFVEHHSLQMGEFLVFRYGGGMQFDVKIFDRSGCEKICFSPITMEDKDSIPCNPKNIVSLSDVYKCDAKGSDVLEKTSTRDILESKRHSATGINGSSTPQEVLSLERTPSFMIMLTPTSVSKCWAHVPTDFVKQGMLRKPSMTLRDASHRSWTVLTRRYPSRAILGRGWASFVKDNHLVVGDKCVFKLVAGTTDVLEVSITRTGRRSASSYLPF